MSEGVRYPFGKAKRSPEAATRAARAAPPTALAMRLALAHYVERCIEDGTLASYADAARRLGITRARMTQVMDLLLLPGTACEGILAETSGSRQFKPNLFEHAIPQTANAVEAPYSGVFPDSA